MHKLLSLFLTILLSASASIAETWTPCGTVEWTDAAMALLYSDGYDTRTALCERSDNRLGVFRIQPYTKMLQSNVYLYLHTEDPNAVYIEYCEFYSGSTGCWYYIKQRCVENGCDNKYYGNINTDGKTIEFPIGAFEVNNRYYTDKVHKIVFPEGVLGAASEPENWVKIGKGYWEDPFFTADGEPLCGYTEFEKCVEKPGLYRIAPYDENYIRIHATDTNPYIEPYSVINTGGVKINFTQRCWENDIDEDLYGTFENGTLTIPAQYFLVSAQGYTDSYGKEDRICKVVLPSGFDNPIEEENGVFMGMIAFSDELRNKPISVLNKETMDDYISFIDGLEKGNATWLYYAVDNGIDALQNQKFPSNLSNAVVITFTDGLDQGSVAFHTEYLNSEGYAAYLADRISKTQIQGVPLEAYAYGLESDEASNPLFMQNLYSLASSENNVATVTDMKELQSQLTGLYENLNKRVTKRTVSVGVPMMSHDHKYRFTLDYRYEEGKSKDVNISKIWFEGDFNMKTLSIENIVYHGFTSASGTSIKTEQNGAYVNFALEDCRDLDGGALNVRKNDIGQWEYVPSIDYWQPNTENVRDESVNIEDVKTSVAIMFALDCSNSLGSKFDELKDVTKTFVRQLAGDTSEIIEIEADSAADFDVNDPDVQFYNLRGMKVDRPSSGIYICRKGSLSKKAIF